MLPWLITYCDDEPGEMVYKTNVFSDKLYYVNFYLHLKRKDCAVQLTANQHAKNY